MLGAARYLRRLVDDHNEQACVQRLSVMTQPMTAYGSALPQFGQILNPSMTTLVWAI